MFISAESLIALELKEAIQKGQVESLKQLLAKDAKLATAQIGDATQARSLLHIATDWPGHFPNSAAVIQALVDAGADVNSTFTGTHSETPLHWAASCDDVAALDALLDAGAAIDAPGAVIGGGTPLADARAFQQLNAARRLIERGASVDMYDAATLGLMDHLEKAFAANPPSGEKMGWAFWSACHGGQLPAAKYLHQRGANVRVVPHWDKATPLEVARRNKNAELVEWLVSVGG